MPTAAARRLVNRDQAPDPAAHAAIPAPAGQRRVRPLPQLAMPASRDRSRIGVLLSAALHALVALLFIVPLTVDRTPIVPVDQGAGGPGPAGGGGGGNRGTGGDRERVRFVAVRPPAPAPAAATAVVPPLPVPPPVAPVSPPVRPAAPTAPQVAASDQTSTPAPVPGVGGGTGSDGTAGTGSGTGGGVGTGVGTGRGSSVGPGTGGGTQANHPPSPIEMFLPPLPAPANVRGFRLIAEFDVDSTGRVLDFKFTETRNGGYNRQLRDVLRSIRFRPGTRPDGTAVRMKVQLEYTF